MSFMTDEAARLPAAPRGAPGPDPADGPAARLLAIADQCVQCGLCLPHCPTYRLERNESESPRGRIAWARAVADDRLAPTPAGDRHLDHCLGCRRCESACPAGVDYGQLLVLARTAQAERRPLPAVARRVLALLRRPRRLAMLLALYRLAYPLLPARWRPLPRPPAAGALPARGAATATGDRPAIFVGCVARTYESGSREALLALLRAAGHDGVIPDGQGCCGAAAAHAGLARDAAGLGAANRAAFASQAQVLCLASGCHDTLARSLGADQAGRTPAAPAAPFVHDPLAWLDRHGTDLHFRRCERRVALHLPCTQRSVVRSDAALVRLLARVPGLDLVLLPDTGCCGAAGLHQLTEAERAAALRQPLLAAFAASGASELLSANIGCRLHLGSGTTLPVRHPIDFLAEHLA